MTTKCPNKNSVEWKTLVSYFGENRAMAIFMVKEELPDIDVINGLIEIDQKSAPKVESVTEQIVKEIENTDKSVIVSNVEEYFDVISKHLRNLRERKSYQKLKKIFTTEDNINKLSTLQDILSEAKKAQDDIEDDRRRIRAIAQTIVQIGHLSDLILEDIKSIVQNTDDSIENLHILQTYLNTINDWDILLDEANKSFAIGNPITTKKIGEVKLKLNQIESYIAKNDESGVVKTLQKILIPASQDLIKSINQELYYYQEKRKNQVKRKANAKTLAETDKIVKALEEKKLKFNFLFQKNVIDFLKGKRGDASVWNSWLESFRDSSDPTISAFAQFVKEQIDEVNNKVYKIDLQYQKDLAPLIKESERLDPAKLNSKLVFTDTIIQDGERTSILTLLNEYGNGYRADYSEKLNKEAELKDRWRESKLEEDKQEYLQAKKDRQKFEQDFLHTEFKPEVYEKYKLFEDEIGQELKQEIDIIFNKIAEIDEDYKLFGHELSEEQTLEKEAYLLQYKMLGNLNKPDGTPKTGKELDKAKRMQEIRALNRQFYVWKDNLTQFEKAKERHSESLLSKGVVLDSPEYKDEMFKWEENNTRTVIKDEFYKTRDAIVREIALLTKKFKNKDLEENISELWKTIQSITYGLRDEDGQPIGILVQEKGAERIKIAQEAIQELQDKLTKISGLTKQEQQDLNDLYSKAKSGVITQEERADLEDLIAKSKTEGLSDREKKRLFGGINKATGEVEIGLFQMLQELQSNIPTEYYTQTANNLTTKYGVTILDSGDILENDRVVPFLQSNKLQELLKHKDFKSWFDLNHYQVEKFNKETKQVEKQWKRTYQWNRIVPNDSKFIDVKPALKYSYREIKPEYKTERIIGKTVDNKGNWLPDLSKSDKYKNQAYFNLINSNDPESKRLSKILDIHTKYLLNTQEGLARTNKLYLDVPRVEREGKEQNITFAKQALESPGDIPKHIWERIKEKYRQLTNYDIQETRYESPFEGKYDKDFIKVPMKYIGKVSVDQVSLDLYRSISKYTYASELNKQLVESLPVARAIQRVVEREDEHKPFKKKSSNRLNAIRRIITKEYEGQKSNLELKNLGALEKPITAVINLSKYLAVQSTIKINLPASIANVVNATMQNLVNAGNDLYSNKTYATSLEDYSTRFFPAWQRDYYENKLGNLSLESQLVDVWNPVQSDEIQKTIGEKFSKSIAYDTLSANWLFNTREWGEFFVQSRTWISALKETKVNLGQDVISLIDAYELDDKGFIKLKDGIDKSWDIGGENFNRLKYKIQALNRKIHGNYASYDKTQVEMFAIGSLAMFLKRFFYLYGS